MWELVKKVKFLTIVNIIHRLQWIVRVYNTRSNYIRRKRHVGERNYTINDKRASQAVAVLG
jgi:hypothetical protein